MNKLGDRNYTLISMAAGSFGTFNPDKILVMFEEELYVDEYYEIVEFLQWCHDNNKTFGSGNYEYIFSEFKNMKWQRKK